jgi:hypothetical protein
MSGMHSLNFNEMCCGTVRPAGWKGHRRKKADAGASRAPLLISSLEVHEPGVADAAHASLVKLAGRDLGREPESWRRWWRESGGELLEHDRLSKAAGELFARVKNAVAAGSWEQVHALLSFRTRRKVGGDVVESHMLKHAALLRRVYRDAAVTAVRLDGERCALGVDWGQTGFKMEELPLVLEHGEWRIDRLPWDWRVVERSERAEAQRTAGAAANRRLGRIRAGSGSGRFLRGGLLALPVLGVLIAAAVTPWFVWIPAAGLYAALLAVVALYPRGERRLRPVRRKSQSSRRRLARAEQGGV